MLYTANGHASSGKEHEPFHYKYLDANINYPADLRKLPP